MAGMIELKGFPMRDQLKSIVRPSDGGPDENRVYNCVPTCLAACVQYFDGKVIASDDIHDAVYGDRTIGGGSELRYASLMAKPPYNLHLGYTALESASQAIIDHIRTELRAGHPVILTMHSQWSQPWFADKEDGLHVGVAYAIDESDKGQLWIMNPWPSKEFVNHSQRKPVTWWRDRLGFGVWPVSKIAVPVMPPPLPPKPAPAPPEFVWNEATKTLSGNGAKLILASLERN